MEEHEGHVHHKKRLPETRNSITHKVVIYSEFGDADVFMTVGMYESGLPGELFLNIGKSGSTLRAVLDSWARGLSIGLQWGVPLSDMVDKFRGVAFEPAGATSNKDIPKCASPIDYAMQWLERTFADNG